MQTEINNQNYWKGKRIQEARESAAKNTIGLLDIAERLGLLKNKYKNFEELFIEYNGIQNKLYDNILENIQLEQKTEKQPSNQNNTEIGTATEKQRRAVWAIIWGDNGRLELADELSVAKEELNDLSFQEASDFIDMYGKKKT